MRITTRLLILLATVPLVMAAAEHARQPDRNAQALAVMKSSFKAKGQAGMDRLDQDPTQAMCSLHAPGAPPAGPAAKVIAANLGSIKLPADGKFLGDWKQGQAIAEEGTGGQYSDDPTKPSGGNCYACHQLDKQEVAYGTIGPSLYQYGKNRGRSDAMLRLTWNMIYDMKAYSLCSAMPRFGSKGILTEQQIKDVMALLFDPESPVNK
jgi:sulfur-oxidizing protein SoxX